VVEGLGDLGDLTPFLESAAVDKSLATDLPDEAKLDSGSGAAAGTVTLAGSLGGVPLTQILASAGNPLTDLAPRIGAPVRIEMGMRTSAGVETLRQLTGSIDSASVDPGSRSVTLGVLDNRAAVRTPVTFPVTVAQVGTDLMTTIATANGFTPVLDTSRNTGVATPAVDSSDPWTLLQQLADAEQGVILFDENGTMRFYNRDHLTGGTAVATITTDPRVAQPSLKALTSAETSESIRNYVTVTANPYALDAPNTIIWAADDVWALSAGVAYTVPIEFDAPLHTTTSFAYGACTTSDGLGTNITNLVFGFAQTGTTTGNVSIYNPNGFIVYLVYSTAFPGLGVGLPALQITGRLLRPTTESGYVAIGQNLPSQIRYGIRSLDVSGNPFRQSGPAASALADYLAGVLGAPHPTLSGVQIVGDPRLQLGDRVRVTEPDGLALDGDFWLTAVQTTFSVSEGLAQSVTLRAA
jgi:hypothetical protein